MNLRLPFFGLLPQRSPLPGLLDHYEQIAQAMKPMEESMECYLSGGVCREFQELVTEVETLESKADKIKRHIRNHLPRGLFMAVDKTLFFNYTRRQDNILDAAQEAMHWLGMHTMQVPDRFQKDIVFLLAEASSSVDLLKPALEATVALVEGKSFERQATKDKYRAVRSQHEKVWKLKNQLTSDIYNSEMPFKDVFQIIKYIQAVTEMSHNAEGCADILRSMIAR
jgi:hypothetical protein